MQQLSLVLTSATALTWLVDLAAVPSKRTVSLLAEGCPCPPEAAMLRQLATEEGYKEKVRGDVLICHQRCSNRYRGLGPYMDLPSLKD
jgi:hypothetical protein